MIKKITLAFGSIALSLLLNLSANAAVYNLNTTEASMMSNGDITLADINSTDGLTASSNDTGVFSHTYTINAAEDINLFWEFDVTKSNSGGNPSSGIKSLTFNIGGTDVFLTDAGGMLIGDLTFWSTLLGTGSVLVTVSGEMYGAGTSGYGFEVAAVPLPPSVLFFGTAIAGIGFLARRKRQAMDLNA